jgi:ribA/ribD-fused uncharacterized protein
METIALFDENIPLTPKDLSRNAIRVRDVLQKKLKSKLEGRCSRDGWVKPGTLKILSHSMGYVESGRFTGDIVFHTKCEGTVINPSADVIVQGEVIRKNKMGIYVNMDDAVRIILPRDHPSHIGNEEYDTVAVGEKVSVMIKKSRFQVNDEYILSVGIFEGKEGAIPFAPAPAAPAPVARVPVDAPAAAAVEEEEVEEEAEEEAEAQAEEKVAEAPAAVPIAAPLAQENTTPIEFYSKIPTYREFSNFFPSAFDLDGKRWPTTEHYFQAQKFTATPEYQEEIRLAKTPEKAKNLGGSREKPIRADWDQVREDVMKKALKAKFTQNADLKALLLGTGNRPLVEANPTDSYWGYGRTKKGKNRMGILLQQLRDELRAANAGKPTTTV